MRLLEHQAKELFTGLGIPVPKGGVARTAFEANQIAKRIGFPLIMKPQVLVGGRGKAGAIIKVNRQSEVEPTFRLVSQKEISGSAPEFVLLEEFVPHDKELYLSVALDRGRRSFILIASGEGGVDVERIGEKVVRDIGLGNLSLQDALRVSHEIGLTAQEARSFADLAVKAAEASSVTEAELFEINPVAVTSDGTIRALDAKVIIDDNALFRHPEFSGSASEDELEQIASSNGFSFVRLGGSIAVIGNGAGLVLSTLDLATESGGEPACFLDLGGGASTERVVSALAVVDKFDTAKKILLNIFGGITRCTDVAEGIRVVHANGQLRKPLYVRLSGSGEDEAREMLKEISVKVFATAEDAVRSLLRGD